MFGFFSRFTLRKAGLDQLFDDTGAGGGRAQPLALGIFGHILRARRFHRGQQGVLTKMLGRRGLALLDRGDHHFKSLPLSQYRQRLGRILLVVLRLLLERRTKTLFGFFPAGGEDGFAFGGESMARAVQRDGRFGIVVFVAHGADQPGGDHVEDGAFPGRERVEVGFPHSQRGNDGVVVGYLGAVDYLPRIHICRRPFHKRQGFGDGVD